MRTSIPSALAAITVAALVAAIPGAPARGDGTELALVMLDGGGFEVAVVSSVDGAPSAIVAGQADDLDPAWAPGGDRLAVARHMPRNPTSDIWTMDPGGGGAIRLTSDFGRYMDRHPAWSPDGRRIAWTRSVPRTGTSSIWIMDARDGVPARPLTQPPPGAADSAPAWSPDGRRIAFQSDRGSLFPDLYVIRSDGGGLRRLTETRSIEGSPAWSPDGEVIAFERTVPGGNADLWTLDLATAEQRRLTRTGAWETDPAWSPDGDRIAFVGAPDQGGDRDILSVSADGSDRESLVAGPGAVLAPAWRPAAGPVAATPGSAAGAGARSVQPSRSPDPADHPARYSLRRRRLMEGVRYERIVDRRGPNRIFVVRTDPSGGATIDVGLGSEVLPGYERTTSIAARHGAIAAINGDFPVPGNGRPSHAYAEDGELGQISFARSEVFSPTAEEPPAVFRRPVERITVRESDSGEAWRVARWNARRPASAEVAAYSPLAAGLGIPPTGSCSARLVPTGATWWTDGRSSVAREHLVDEVACRRERLHRRAGVVLSARPGTTEALLVASLSVGEAVSLEWTFGWAGATDAMGGIPLLVRDGEVAVSRCRASLCRRHPRTGVGVTDDGTVLMVVVDGRRRLSRGLTLVGFARLFRQLGATWALNLDGGGSSTMVVGRRIVNVPSDGSERPVCCAIMVLPGPDPGEVIGELGATAVSPPGVASRQVLTREVARRVAVDPASSGGLADALARGALEGYGDLPVGFRSALRAFRSAERSRARPASS